MLIFFASLSLFVAFVSLAVGVFQAFIVGDPASAAIPLLVAFACAVTTKILVGVASGRRS